MKRVVSTVLVFICLGLFPFRLSAKGDKLKHFGFSALFGAAGESCLHYTTEWKDFYKISLGTAIGILPGFVKEIVDSTKEGNHFCGADLAADFAGSLCGAILSNVVNNFIKINVKTEKYARRFTLSVTYTF